MRHFAFILLSVSLALSTLAENQTYHINAFRFDVKISGNVIAAGQESGDPEICAHLFTRPITYDGHIVQIGTNATAFGAVAVTDGRSTRIIPLFKWTDAKGVSHFGCNGPAPLFAHHEYSQDALVTSLLKTLREK